MKKIFTLMLFMITAFISKAQYPDHIYMNGNQWLGITDVCPNSTVNLTFSTSGGNPPYTCQFLSETGDTLSNTFSLNNAAPGFYVIRLYKNDTIIGDADFYVIESDPLIVTLQPTVQSGGTNISEFGGHDGHIQTTVQGGVTPYTYEWSNGATTLHLDSALAGTHTIIVTDHIGCKDTVAETLTEPAGPLRFISVTSPIPTAYNGYNVSEKGKMDGAIDVVVAGGAGPYTYQYYPYGENKPIADSLGAREYTVVVTDTNKTVISRTITLREPLKLELSLSKTTYSNGYNVSCFNCNDGSITANVTGGAGSYSYVWSNGNTTSTISNLSPRDYVLTVIDGNGAKVKEGVFLKGPERDDWSIQGNTGIQANQFLGTTDNADFVLKSNNQERLRLTSNGLIKSTALSGSGYDILMADPDGSFLRVGPGGGTTGGSVPCFPWSTCGNIITSSHFIGSTNPSDVIFKSNNNERFRILSTGNIGIGTTLPSTTLEVRGTASISALTNAGDISFSHNGTDAFIEKTIGGHLRILSAMNTMNINDFGQVGIGIDPSPSLASDYSLFVSKGIMAEKVMVALKGSSTWPDYVFKKDYDLKNIDSLKAYIHLHKHLPDVPSAEENVKNGVDILQMQILQLKKLEELTLYVIQLKEENDKLRKLITNK